MAVLMGQMGSGAPLHPCPHYYTSQSPSQALDPQADRAQVCPSIRSFIHSSNILLSTYYALRTVLDSGDTAVNTTGKVLVLEQLWSERMRKIG